MRGFTLIEIIMVIAVLAICASMFLPFRGLVIGFKTRTIVKDMVSTLRWARSKAIILNKTLIFRIYRDDDLFREDNDDNIDYLIYYKNQDNSLNVVKIGSYPGSFKLYKNIHPRIIEENFYERIRFTGQGTALSGTIGLKNESGDLYQIIVSQLGRVRLESE